MHPTICTVLINYNGLPDTSRCLRSLEAAGRPATVVVDNASAEDPSPALRRDFPWCPVVRNPVNGGWAGGNNVGVRYALERGADLVVLLNNDTVVAPDFVARLTAAAAAHPAYGVLGPVIRFMDPPHEVQTDGCMFNGPARPGFFQRKPVAFDDDSRADDHRRGHRQRLLHDDPRRRLPPHRPYRRAFLPDPRGVRLLPPRPPGPASAAASSARPWSGTRVPAPSSGRGAAGSATTTRATSTCCFPSTRPRTAAAAASFTPFGSISSTLITATPWSARRARRTQRTPSCRDCTTRSGASVRRPSARGRGWGCPSCEAPLKPGA